MESFPRAARRPRARRRVDRRRVGGNRRDDQAAHDLVIEHHDDSGACVPIASDVDGGGGTGNGPAYVYVKDFPGVGRYIHDLDSDKNGIACESPKREARSPD